MTTTRQAPRKRRRPPRSDWQFPVLTDLGMAPSRQKLIVIVATVAGVVALACGLVFAIASLGGFTPDREAGGTVGGDAVLPATYTAWSSPKLFAPVLDRAKDAKPLTDKEVFAQKTLTGGKKLTLKLAARRIDADCSAAVWGEELRAKVADAGCNQAARGLYTSSDGRYLGQYTLLNLRDGQAATDLVESLKLGYRGGWVQALPAGSAAFPRSGYSEGAGYALGHYVGLVWLGRIDGAEPTARDDFVGLALTLRGAEKAVYRRVVTITGPKS
ncbi:hypothetical protein GCM10010149_27020 [Nonomuraea roseoviolacea subsp. roseoviolacea]|uniref:Uncharacterized protein n=1 Tax=Nonomuraea roseoviolacea subsp. carminata TaxID=160689 RepID=A0ABT1JR51_9ACTN|nr:hypothetical protein [Nonomuraea roseoviolacea]MCP2344208.1 hypothetical protein [Nonomuraea roseoviolacea subsp. carminata]